MNTERPLVSELSHFLPYSRDGRCAGVPIEPMPKVMNSLSGKPYASEVSLERGRAVFLLSPLQMEEKNVAYSKNDLMLYETTNPATVRYDIWIAATEKGFKAMAKRKAINGDESFGSKTSDYADALSNMEWVYAAPYSERESEKRKTLFLYGVDAKTGSVKDFTHDLDSATPLGMNGSFMRQYNVVDLSLVNQAIWKSRETASK